MTTDRELMQQALDLLDDINQCSLPPTGIPLPAEIDHVMEALRARLANEFNPDWDAMAVMVEEQQRMAKRIEELKERLLQVELNPSTARLAQPEQEPVAWITDGGKGELWWHQSVKFDDDGNLIGENPDDIPLYTAPPQREWQGLTDEEVRDLWSWSMTAEAERTANTQQHAFARAIEAKLKEKNNG